MTGGRHGYMQTKSQRFTTCGSHVGMVFQNPDNQIVATIVEEDVAFGPENLGHSAGGDSGTGGRCLESRWRCMTIGMHAPSQLSGGQKQRSRHCRHYRHATGLYRLG